MLNHRRDRVLSVKMKSEAMVGRGLVADGCKLAEYADHEIAMVVGPYSLSV